MYRSATPCAVSRSGAFHPDLIPAERLDEIAEILAAGILRVRIKLRGKDRRDSVRLDFLSDRSVHTSPQTRRRRRA